MPVDPETGRWIVKDAEGKEVTVLQEGDDDDKEGGFIFPLVSGEADGNNGESNNDKHNNNVDSGGRRGDDKSGILCALLQALASH